MANTPKSNVKHIKNTKNSYIKNTANSYSRRQNNKICLEIESNGSEC